MDKPEAYPTGAFQPPNSLSSRSATASAISSLHGAATICTPIGRPLGPTPQRTTAAGHPATFYAMVWLKPWKFSSRVDVP